MVDPFRREVESKEICEVNVVPLADVSLVLLIILLILSPMMTQAMLQVQAAGRSKEEPPQAEEPGPEEPKEAQPQDMVLVVALGPDSVSLGEKTFKGTSEFMVFLQGELSRRADKKVFLSPHPDVTHGKVVNMIESLKDCGAASVALVQVAESPPEQPEASGPGSPPDDGPAAP